MQAITVVDESQVAEARRIATRLAEKHGFREEDFARVALVVTELATNLVKHGAGGELIVGAYEDSSGSSVECLALDKGPGIANVAAALRDGHSTAGSAGTGLGAISRGSHLLDIYSRPGLGTAILARLQQGRPDRDPAGRTPTASLGAVSLPKPGETECGDAWSIRPRANGVTLMVADGLGHGPLAAEAAAAAVRVFDADYRLPSTEILKRMHLALRPTRGAAVAIADLDMERRRISFAGIGNVAGIIVSSSGMRQMVSHNGMVGHMIKRIQEFSYPFDGTPLVVLCSDGLSTRWSLDAYPGLVQHHPTLIAGILYRDFRRGRDDVTISVARGETT